LLDFLAKSKQFTVRENGEVTINDKLLPQTNIVHLINDVIRDRPKVPPPFGHLELVTLLKDLNVPKHLVGNPARWNMINDNFQTPVSKTPKQLKRKLRFTQKGSGSFRNVHPNSMLGRINIAGFTIFIIWK